MNLGAMTNFSMKTLLKPILFAVSAAALVASQPLAAQKLQPRITAPIDNANRVTLVGSRPSRSIVAKDVGAVDPAKQLHSISLDFSRTPAQQAELDALLVAQQDIHSPLYHQWLTPEQFGARFGVSDADIASVKTWLTQQGFTIDRVSRGNNHIAFSGTAGQVEAAFGAPLHNFQSADGSIHFAPATDLKLPAALASSVMSIRNVSNYLPKPHYKRAPTARRDLHPEFTDAKNSYYLLTPQDLATIYDVNSAYKAGYTGAGQSIAVVGQSYILPSDIATFQSLAGVPTAKAPIFVLVPATGSPERFQGDESESDIDVEYSSTIAPGAQVYFVYTGSDNDDGAFYAIQYAIDEKIAPIITNSYGDCELNSANAPLTGTATTIAAFDSILQQGNAQGQTILAPAGDDGAVDCIGDAGEGLTTTQLQSLAVDYPASSVYVTGMGGTAFTPAEYTYPNTTYWNSSTGGTALVNSAKTYIPEVVWNDDDPVYGTSAGGGGISTTELRPTWQKAGTLIGGVALPTGNYRLVPDISLFASPNDPGMLICSSDPGSFYPGQTSSCTNGFYDASSGDLTVYGGTSFDGPIFAGMLAIINQALNSTGQGNINPTLYSIAASSTTTYASAFHDITSGSNACYDFTSPETGFTPPVAIPGICGTGAQTTSFAATTGYDEASGLGSVDLNNLITAWPKPASALLIATTTTVTAATGTPALSATDNLTITVGSASTAATGTVSVSVDNVVVNSSLGLLSGTATYAFSSGFLGAHIVTVTYSGDATHAASTGVVSLYVGTTTPSFTIAATNVTVTAGNSSTSTVLVTPINGYTGKVSFAISAPSNLTNACATGSSVTVYSPNQAVPMVVTIYTNINSCPSGAVALIKGATGTLSNGAHIKVVSGSVPTGPTKSPWKRAPLPVALAGLLVAFCTRRRSRLLRAGIALGFVMLISLAGFGLSGCSNNSSAGSGTTTTTTTSYNSAKGTYTIGLSASDSLNPTLGQNTTFTLTVQ
jgi:subtilase family serine protease